MIWYWDHMSHPGFLNLTLESYVMHGGLAYWTWVFFAICLPFQKSRVFWTPLPPPNEPYNFLCEMAPYIEIWYAYGGVPSPAEKDSLCGTVMMAWIWHVWINATVFVPTAKAPPKAGAKELSYSSLNLACSGQHPRFGPNWFVQFCHTWRWIGYA